MQNLILLILLVSLIASCAPTQIKLACRVDGPFITRERTSEDRFFFTIQPAGMTYQIKCEIPGEYWFGKYKVGVLFCCRLLSSVCQFSEIG